MLSIVIFSKDRACQLDALLRSMETHLAPTLDYVPTVVLWKGEGDFADGYALCRSDHPRVAFVREQSFQDDLESLISVGRFVMFLTDDDLFHGPADLADAVHMLDSEWVAAFSFRLGENTTECYPLDREQALPVPRHTFGRTMTWQWTDADADFGYPASVDGHVLRAVDVRALIKGGWFANPNQFEELMASRALEVLGDRREMASYSRSVLSGLPVNRVNATHPNRAGGAESLSAVALSRRYLDGERIDLDAIDYTGINAAHCELDLVLA